MDAFNTYTEWSYAQDELGIVYCLGLDAGSGAHEMVATYYQTEQELATKQTLDADRYYRRLIYQGLPEERERLEQIERPEVIERLLAHTSLTNVGIFLEPAILTPSDPSYKDVTTWLNTEHLGARAFQAALDIAGTALARVGVSLGELSLYGGASFGVVNTTPKVVDDIDVVFRASNRDELSNVLNELQSAYTWEEIDPFGRLPKERQILKAKRWSTSQVRLAHPYPMSIDFKVARNSVDDVSLWNALPEHTNVDRFIGDVRVIDDSEALCTSPALRCEDANGNERLVLLDGYQYIGCAVKGDVMSVIGNTYQDSNVIRVTQSATDGVVPDFRTVPIS